MGLKITDLPQVCLEEIFKYLTFAEISRVGAVCKYFREVAKTIFRIQFIHQEKIIEKEMEKLESEANKSEKLTIEDHLHMALLHSILRILLSEAKIMKAHCWRYMRDPSYDFCFPAGLILDEFEEILENVKDKSLNKDMEPQITTTLFHLGETFYDYFDTKIENCFQDSSKLQAKIMSETNRHTILPNIYNFLPNSTKDTLLRDIHRYMKRHKLYEDEDDEVVNELVGKNSSSKSEGSSTSLEESNDKKEKTLFGIKVLDILDCCATSSFHSLLTHDLQRKGFKIVTEYELRDINVLEALPSVSLSTSTPERQLIKICRYIRNNVRWTNLFHPLQDLWMLEDAIEINRDVETASALLRQWRLQRSSRLTLHKKVREVYQYDYSRIISQFKNRFGLLVSAKLECPSVDNIPLKMEHYLNSDQSFLKQLRIDKASNGNSETFANSLIKEMNIEEWDGKVKTYKFHLQLKIQYPSFLSDTIQEAILKVDQLGEATIVTSGGDDIRRTATCRADEENNDE